MISALEIKPDLSTMGHLPTYQTLGIVFKIIIIPSTRAKKYS